MTTSEIATVLAWHDALNEGDFDTLLRVSSDDIEFGDANGAGQGHEPYVSGRLRRASPPPIRGACTSVTVWSSPKQDGDAVAFRVVRDHVTSVYRHPDLRSALAATELTEEDLAG